MLKALIGRFLPKQIAYWMRTIRQAVRHVQNQQRSPEEVFTETYINNKWGGVTGQFHSGSGTANESAVSQYISAISEIAYRQSLGQSVLVDLGCGDFEVGKRLAPLAAQYIGVDVVGPLVARNALKFGDSKIQFLHLDILTDDIPDGDICLLRQVLQHLSNDQIRIILAKLTKYRSVIITEHQPQTTSPSRRNLDKVHGPDTRLYSGSGVYLTDPPFNLPEDKVSLVLDIPDVAVGERSAPTAIRSYLYTP